MEPFEVDERRWRERVRVREQEIHKLRAELNAFLAHSANAEPDSATLDAEIDALKEENKKLKNEMSGLRMQLGRYQKKENKG